MAVQYATLAELKSRYGAKLVDEKAPRPADFNPASPTYTHVTAWADGILLKASREIDGYLRMGGYAAPLVNSDGLTPLAAEVDRLREWCIAIACGLAELGTVGETEPAQTEAGRARAELQALSMGRIRLDAPLEDSIVGGSITPASTDVGPLGRVVQFARMYPDR